MNTSAGLCLRSTILLCIFLIFNPVLIADDQNPSLPTPTHSLDDTIALQAFVDGLMLAYMDKQQIAGATIGVIHQGKTTLLKGYGYADVERGIRIDPALSMFRIGSVSKLFTWLAVLQQYEAGRLDLDTDINRYLTAFQIPDTFDEPITLRSLMSHTPGFEDILLELFIRPDKPMPDLEELFQSRLPRRIMPPLTEAAYSNHGTGLAQYIVEQVSGMPFETYVEKHIFDPLGMHCSTFRQPLPDHLSPYLSHGYAYKNNKFVPQEFEVVPMTGAGGASSTAADMLLFMKALLNNTRQDTISLLDSANYAIMNEPVLFHAPNMNPALPGFLDMSVAHAQIIGHGGNTFLFHTMFAMLPEHETGIFMSFNSENGSTTSYNIMKQFIDRYFPDPEPSPRAMQLDKEYLQGFTGTYISNRRPYSDALKLIGVLMGTEVFMEEENLMFRDFFGNINPMIPVDSTSFFVEEEQMFVGFRRQHDEKAEKLYVSNFPIMAFDRASGLMNLQLHAIILVIGLVVMLYILIVWPWIYFIRRNYEKSPRTPHPLPVFTKLVAWLTSFFFAIFLVMIIQATSGGTDIVFGIPSSMRIALFFPLAAIPMILLMIYSSIYIWKTPKIRKISKLFYTIATLSFILTIWQLHYWNLLGWQY